MAEAMKLSRLAQAPVTYVAGETAAPAATARLSTPAQLMWWRFKRHKVAVCSLVLLLLMYTAALLADFVAPHDPDAVNPRYASAPSTSIHFFEKTGGGWRFHPHVSGYTSKIDPATRERLVVEDPTQRHAVRLFVSAAPFRLLGVLPMRTRLIGTVERDAPFFWLGSEVESFSSVSERRAKTRPI